MNDDNERLLDTHQVAEMLHMREETVRKLITSGKLRASRPAKGYLCRPADVEALLYRTRN